MLAEITLDMSAIAGALKTVAMVVLVVIGLLMFGLPVAAGKLRSMLKPVAPAPPIAPIPSSFQQVNEMIDDKISKQETATSSDQKPPAGFTDHLQIIQESAPNADPTVWWEYALRGLTSAEVSRAEARLARLNPEETAQLEAFARESEEH